MQATVANAMTVRPARLRDVPALSRFIRLCWQAAYRDILTPSQLARSTGQASSWLALSASILGSPIMTMVAEQDDCVVGLASAMQEPGGQVVLFMLYVHPQRQRRGIGTDLLNRVIAHWPETSEVRLEVLKANAAAIAFYERIGFESYGETPNATGTPSVPSIYMDRRFVPGVPPAGPL